MEKQMNKSKFRLALAILLVAMLVLIAVLAAFWVIVGQPMFPGLQERQAPSTGIIPGDLEFFYGAYTIISTLNIALLVLLTTVYVDIYIKTRSQFTIGLIIFALVFLVKDLTSSPLITSLLGFRAYGLGPFEFLPGLFECFALSILLYLSIKY
jgi:hypothetical protein